MASEKDAEVQMRQDPGAWGDGGPGAEVTWTDADADSLGLAVAKAADTGVLLMLSRSQDGGALMAAVMDNGETTRRWFHNVEDAVRAIEGIPAYLATAASTPSPRREGRNGQRPRRRR